VFHTATAKACYGTSMSTDGCLHILGCQWLLD